MMLFAPSIKLKLESMCMELNEIKTAFSEVLGELDSKTALNSLKGLKSGLKSLNNELIPIMYKYDKINDMLYQVDIMISDYYEINIEIDLYELNGIENDLLGLKGEYDKFKSLKLDMDNLKKEIDGKISHLKSN